MPLKKETKPNQTDSYITKLSLSHGGWRSMAYEIKKNHEQLFQNSIKQLS